MTAIKCSEEVLTVAEGNNNFILDFQSKMYPAFVDDNIGGFDIRNFNKNMFYSGISISSLLAMMWDSFKNKKNTEATQLLSCLQLSPKKQQYITDGYSEVMNEYMNAVYGPQDTILNIVSKMYTCVSLGSLDAEFRNKVLQMYRCGHESISFGSRTIAAEKINADFTKETNGLFQHTVDKEMIPRSSQIVLVSSFHFQGIWEEPFDPKLTKIMEFTQGSGNKIKVHMMFKKRATGMSYTNFRSMNCHACCLYFEGFRYCMIVVRPKIVTGFYNRLLENMKNELSPDKLIGHFKRYQRKSRRGGGSGTGIGGLTVNVWMPRFRIKSCHMLNQQLKEVPHSPWSNTGSKFSDAFENNVNPSLTQMVQRCYIDINEAGATHEESTTPMIPARPLWNCRPKCTQMKLDRCFYFVLFDYTNNFLIAAGIVNNPNDDIV